MWTAGRAPARPHRTESVHSIASVYSNSRPGSMISPQLVRQPSRSGGYESDQSSDTAAEDEYAQFPAVPGNNMPPMWQSQRQQSGSAVSRLSQKFGHDTPAPLRTQQFRQESYESSPHDDARSRSSTLNDDEHEFEFPEKTPTSIPRRHKMEKVDEERAPTTHVPGPLESQLAALMSKLVFMEQKNPVVSVTPDDYQEMSQRLKALEEEKKSWTKRHEAIWALRDEDVENNIKIRGMLAKARRELEGMTKLRDEDLVNVQVVRARLAESTRQLERLQAQNDRSSPSRGRPGSMLMERRQTMDLFAVAKAAALEQRAIELEKRNGDLLSQIEALKGGTSIDDLNSMTAHKVWKDTVTRLEAKLNTRDAEILRLRAGGDPVAAPRPASMVSASPSGATTGGVEWHRVEALHEEHSNYRERIGGKLQALRSEKEGLQRDLHRKEDECHALEVKVQNLQRKMSVL